MARLELAKFQQLHPDVVIREVPNKPPPPYTPPTQKNEPELSLNLTSNYTPQFYGSETTDKPVISPVTPPPPEPSQNAIKMITGEIKPSATTSQNVKLPHPPNSQNTIR